jgi:hypothetical protein
MIKKAWAKTLLACLGGWAIGGASLLAHAAQVDAGEFKDLMAEAKAKGVTRVMVNLDMTVTLDSMRSQREAGFAAANAKAGALLAELGAEAWKTGYWSNGLGQVGLYVTPNGLKYLANSGNARSFLRDPTDKMRTRLFDEDGRLKAIEARIDSTGYADVEVVLNIESLEFDVGRDQAMKLLPSQAAAAEALALRQQFLDSLNPQAVPNLAALRTGGAGTSPTVAMRLTREGFHLLREHGHVRSMKLQGFVDTRAAKFDPDALAAARRDGSAEVIITLRGNEPFQPGRGYLPEKAWHSQSAAMRRAFAEILAEHEGGILHVSDLSSIATVIARVSEPALARIYRNADPRVLSVSANRPAAVPLLATSTVLVNMPGAWNAGYRAAGQTIVVYDSGVRKSHEFFKSATGASRVTLEACWGSAGTAYGLPYSSICPNPNAQGDSPLNQLNSGEPYASCPAANMTACSHGTHVAGIAGGRNSPLLPTGLQGMAPDANLIAAQVFSYNTTGTGTPTAFISDLVMGIQVLDQQAATGDFVANFSLGMGRYTGGCTEPSFTLAVSNLHSRGIPVVAATGNEGQTNAIAFPACTPKVIKVGGTVNSGTGNVVSTTSNMANPALYDGPFLLAPGFNVRSAYGPNTTAVLGGTSQASPHVAGYYAVVKAAIPGISVPDATAWIVGTGSVPVTYNTFAYRRIQAPSF